MTYNQRMIQVAEYDARLISEALEDGRLYIQAQHVSATETRSEVMSIVSRILGYANDEQLVNTAWQTMLSDQRIKRFRLTHKQMSGQINRYRIAAIVYYMMNAGLYQCPFRALCTQLFPEEDADRYRRNCLSYDCYEEENIIRHMTCSGKEGRHE